MNNLRQKFQSLIVDLSSKPNPIIDQKIELYSQLKSARDDLCLPLVLAICEFCNSEDISVDDSTLRAKVNSILDSSLNLLSDKHKSQYILVVIETIFKTFPIDYSELKKSALFFTYQDQFLRITSEDEFLKEKIDNWINLIDEICYLNRLQSYQIKYKDESILPALAYVAKHIPLASDKVAEVFISLYQTICYFGTNKKWEDDEILYQFIVSARIFGFDSQLGGFIPLNNKYDIEFANQLIYKLFSNTSFAFDSIYRLLRAIASNSLIITNTPAITLDGSMLLNAYEWILYGITKLNIHHLTEVIENLNSEYYTKSDVPMLKHVYTEISYAILRNQPQNNYEWPVISYIKEKTKRTVNLSKLHMTGFFTVERIEIDNRFSLMGKEEGLNTKELAIWFRKYADLAKLIFEDFDIWNALDIRSKMYEFFFRYVRANYSERISEGLVKKWVEDFDKLLLIRLSERYTDTAVRNGIGLFGNSLDQSRFKVDPKLRFINQRNFSDLFSDGKYIHSTHCMYVLQEVFEKILKYLDKPNFSNEFTYPEIEDIPRNHYVLARFLKSHVDELIKSLNIPFGQGRITDLAIDILREIYINHICYSVLETYTENKDFLESELKGSRIPIEKFLNYRLEFWELYKADVKGGYNSVVWDESMYEELKKLHSEGLLEDQTLVMLIGKGLKDIETLKAIGKFLDLNSDVRKEFNSMYYQNYQFNARSYLNLTEQAPPEEFIQKIVNEIHPELILPILISVANDEHKGLLINWDKPMSFINFYTKFVKDLDILPIMYIYDRTKDFSIPDLGLLYGFANLDNVYSVIRLDYWIDYVTELKYGYHKQVFLIDVLSLVNNFEEIETYLNIYDAYKSDIIRSYLTEDDTNQIKSIAKQKIVRDRKTKK